MFCYPSQLLRRNRLLDAGWLTYLPRFQEARTAVYVRVESSRCCFRKELLRSFSNDGSDSRDDDCRNLERMWGRGEKLAFFESENYTEE